MVLQIARFNNAKGGLERQISYEKGRFDTEDNFLFEKNTIAFNMDAKVKSDEFHWPEWLDSRTMLLYGGKSEKYEGRYVFKIDNKFPLLNIRFNREEMTPNGGIVIHGFEYDNSTGTEFIFIDKNEIRGAKKEDVYFAIRADKYEAVKEQLCRGIDIEVLLKAGGFKVSQNLSPDEVINYNHNIDIDKLVLTQNDISYVHDGWLELAVGRNKAKAKDYQRAITRLAKYTRAAEKRNCFSDNGKGLGLYIHETRNARFEGRWRYSQMRQLIILSSKYNSNVHGRNILYGQGIFLRNFQKTPQRLSRRKI